jgi:hypothetical protein
LDLSFTSTRKPMCARLTAGGVDSLPPYFNILFSNIGPRSRVLSILSFLQGLHKPVNLRNEKEKTTCPEMKFLDMKLTKGSMLHAINSRFYWRILKKTIFYSSFNNPYQKIRETRKFESIHEQHFVERKMRV